MAEVALKSISRTVGGRPIVRDVTLMIGDREFIVFVGPSGCGKTTLLRLIAGLDDISAGELTIDGQRANALRPKERGVAMVFQSYALYPHMTVFDNLAFGLQAGARSRGDVAARVREAAHTLELTPLLDRLPRALSGGQRQRVAIGRAIVRQPRLFLFDEPLSNLDAALRVQMRLEIARLHRELGATTIYVTHDQFEAMTLADRIVVLKDGRVEQIGAPLDLYHRPANRFVAGFIGSPQMNFIAAQCASCDSERLALQLAGGARIEFPYADVAPRVGAELTLGIRPEHLHVHRAAPDANTATLHARCVRIEQLGDSHLLHAELADSTRLTVKGSGSSARSAGDDIELAIDTQHCHVFDEDGRAVTLRTSDSGH